MCVRVSVCNERSILEAENQNKLKKQKQKPSRQRGNAGQRRAATWKHEINIFYTHNASSKKHFRVTLQLESESALQLLLPAPSWLGWLFGSSLQGSLQLLAAPLPYAAHNSGSVQHSLSGDLHFITSWSSFPPHFSVHFMRRTACPPTSLSPALHRDSLIIMSKSHCECFKGNN